jgi:hypothetical protein
MAFQPDLNPQPISGNVGITGTPSVSISGTPTVTIGSQPISVSVNASVVEDTGRYYDDDITIGSDQTLESNLATGTVIEVININLASADDIVFKIIIKSALGGVESNWMGVFYCRGSFNASPNLQFTVPSSTNDNLIVEVERIGVGSSDVSFSMVYRITPP